MTENAVINDWMRDIQKVARKAEADWPGLVEAEELVQDICIKVLESPATVAGLSAMDSDDRYRTLHKISQRLASKARTDYARFSGTFRFSVVEVRALLESAGDPENGSMKSSWSTGDYTMSGGAHSDATADAALKNLPVSEGRKLLRQALSELKSSNIRQYDVLVERFVEEKTPRDQAQRDMINRALISVTTKMNHGHKREHTKGKFFTVKSPAGKDVRYPENPKPGESLADGVGTRKALSNSTARYLSKEGWDADYTPAPSHMRDNHTEPEVWDA